MKDNDIVLPRGVARAEQEPEEDEIDEAVFEERTTEE